MIVDGTATMATNTEMQKLLTKLRGLIPGIPPNQKMTKLEIMQHVIDYIADLEHVLEQDSNASLLQSLIANTDSGQDYFHQAEMVN